MLYLDSKNLILLPPEIGKLINLNYLDLEGTSLTVLPPEIGQLTKLETLYLFFDTQLTSPPPEVVRRGTKAILEYLRRQLEEKQKG